MRKVWYLPNHSSKKKGGPIETENTTETTIDALLFYIK